jgi:LPXTG-site transpeptidase (sortase) family protein
MSYAYQPPSTKKPKTSFPWSKVVVNTLIIGGIVYLVLSFWPVISAEVGYQMQQWFSPISAEDTQPIATHPAKTFGSLLQEGPALRQTPVNTDFSVVIDKIDVNTPVVPDVNPADKKAYLEALNHGAAHALGTVKPGQVGNSYVFAHSTANILNIEKYAAVFTLLNHLSVGDRITTFYQGKRYDYQIDRKYIVDFTDVSPLLATYDHPVLTLQTCDPPGTEFHRLILVSHLVGTYSK